VSERVVTAMAETFEDGGELPLAERLLLPSLSVLGLASANVGALAVLWFAGYVLAWIQKWLFAALIAKGCWLFYCSTPGVANR